MGEKGIAADALGAVSGSAPSIVGQSASAIANSVEAAASDLAGTIRDKAIGAVADNVVAEGRDRLDRTKPDDAAAGGEPAAT